MKIKIKQCAYFGCPEVVIKGDYCFSHRRYEQAVIRGYSTRGMSGRQNNQTVCDKSKMIAIQKNAKTIDDSDKT